MKLFDCTLRDGANVVGNGFDKELTVSIVKALLNCGITDIEFGNAKGLGAYEKLGAATPLTDVEYMEAVTPFLTRGNIGMFMLANCADSSLVKQAAEHGLAFLRVGNNAGDGEKSIKAVEMVRNAGMQCRYSLMKAYVSTPQELAKEAKQLEHTGVNAITIMDSAGTMTPKETTQYVIALKDVLSIPVGFHGHSNLGLSQANALAAAESGADEIDCGLLGMARSAGNCSTELAIAAFKREGELKDIDLFGLLNYLDDELIPAMKRYDYHTAVTPIDLILGLYGCHSSYLNIFRTKAMEKGVNLYRLIAEVSEIDKKTPSKELIAETAAKLLSGKICN